MLNKSLVQAIWSYLETRPFKEVAGIMQEIDKQYREWEAHEAAKVAPPAELKSE